MSSKEVIATFLYAGGSAACRAGELSLDWCGGHIGFAYECAAQAAAIATALDDALNRMPDVEYPGVLEYELIEPLGLWLAERGGWVEPRDTAARFLRQFREWVI